MARAPKQKAISKEEFKEAPVWLERLLLPINGLLESYAQAVNRGITFEDNITCTIKPITIVTSSTYPTDFETLRFAHGLNIKPFLCLIAQIQKKADNYEPILEPVSISWRTDAGQIVIDFITGLAVSSSYNITFLVA